MNNSESLYFRFGIIFKRKLYPLNNKIFSKRNEESTTKKIPYYKVKLSELDTRFYFLFFYWYSAEMFCSKGYFSQILGTPDCERWLNTWRTHTFVTSRSVRCLLILLIRNIIVLSNYQSPRLNKQIDLYKMFVNSSVMFDL